MLKSGAKFGLAGITRGSAGRDLENIVSERVRPWLSSLSEQHLSQLSKLSVFGSSFSPLNAAGIGIDDTVAGLDSLHGLGLLKKHPCTDQQLLAISSLPEQVAEASSFDRYSMHPLVRVAAHAHLRQDKSAHASTVADFLDLLLLFTASTEAWSILPEAQRETIAPGVSALVANEQQNIREMHRVLEHSKQEPNPVSGLISEKRAWWLQASANGLRRFGHLPAAHMLMHAAIIMRISLQSPGPLINVLEEFAELAVTLGQQQSAEEALRSAVQASDVRSVPSRVRALSHAGLAQFLANQGRPAEAARLLQIALAALRMASAARASFRPCSC